MARWLRGRVWSPAGVALVCGVHLHHAGWLVGWVAPLFVGVGALLVAWRVARRGRTLVAPALVWCALALICGARSAWLTPVFAEPVAQDRPMPRRLPPLQRLVLLESPRRAPAGFRAEARWEGRCASDAGAWRCARRSGTVRLEVRDRRWPALQVGDVVRVAAWVHPPPGYHNEGAEGPWRRWRRAGRVGRVRVASVDQIAVLHRSHPPVAGARAALQRERARVAARLERWAPGRAGAYAAALGVGDRSGFAPELRRWLGRAGVAHLFAVSGAHLGIVVVLVLAVIQRGLATARPGALRLMPAAQWALLPTLLVAWGFALWTGAGRSTLRACAMATVVLCARAADARSDLAESLGLGVCALVLWDGEAALDAGLALSVLGVIGVVAGQQGPGPPWLCAFRASVGAWATTSLVAIPLFGQLPWQGPLASVVFAVPLALVWLPWSILLSVLAAILPASDAVDASMSASAGALTVWIFAPVDAAVGLPGWLVPCTRVAGPRAAVACGAPFAIWWLLMARRPGVRRWLARALTGAGLAAGCVLVSRTGADLPPDGHVALHVFDVGHGDATLVRFSDGRTMLIDGGGELGDDGRVGAQALVPALSALGVRRIDWMVLSHPHPDHENGLLGVARALPVGEFWWNGQAPRGVEHERLMDALAGWRTRWRRFGTVSEVRMPARLAIAGAQVDVLWPRPEAPPFDARANFNDNSLVLQLSVGTSRVLLTGDAEAETERRMLAAGVVPTCVDLLKLGHHGSRTSTTTAWLRTLSPKLAWAGARPWGALPFPHPDIARRVRDARAPLLLSSDGQIDVLIGPRALTVQQRRGPGVRGEARSRMWRWPSGGQCSRDALGAAARR